MIYLSQLILNPASRMVDNELKNPYELHRTLLNGFANKREAANVLHRLDINPHSGKLSLLVQSTVEPNWQPLIEIGQGDYLSELPMHKTVDLALHEGQILNFRLVANPTVKREGKRHALYKEEEQKRWLATKGTGCIEKKRPSHGFKLLDVSIQNEGNRVGRIQRQPKERHKLTVYTVQYNGRLQITDLATFNTALRQGIGPAKAFGCGLLSLAPT